MGIKILLADDSVTAQNMGKKILAEAGHDVVTVSNGAAAAKKIAEASPDLVLLDVFMPGYSGLELCEKLRNAAPTAQLPVLLTVGRMEPYSPQDGARVKADGVIVKPFEASDLIAAVDRLAQKIKGEQSVPQERVSTAKIPPPTQKEASLPQQDKEKEYERTQALDARQIAAMLNEAAPPSSPSGNSAAAPIEEFSVAPPAHTEQHAPVQAATPAFSEELASPNRESKTGAVPSYLAQYLVEHAPPKTEGLPPEPPATAEIPKYSEFDQTVVMEPILRSVKEPKKPSWARNAADTDESSFRSHVSDESMLQHFRKEATTEPPVAAEEGLEFTAAAPVPDVPVAQAPGFESTSQGVDASTFIMKDPALVGGHEGTRGFPTKFGTADSAAPESPEIDAAPAVVDEFEARLNAAMSAYQEPSTDATPEIESSAGSIQAAPSESAESFVARVEAAMHISDAPTSSLPEISLPEHSAAGPETRNEPAPIPPGTPAEHISPEVEFSPFETAANAAIDEAESIAEIPAWKPEEVSPFQFGEPERAVPETLNTEAVSHISVVPPSLEHDGLHEPDEAVIRQMREALSSFPTDSSHVEESPEPMAMAAAAAAAAPTIPSFRQEADIEVARGTADVVELKSSASPILVSDQAEPDIRPPDANKLAAAVERVMKRELPNLIWKIMAELDLKKRD